MKKLLTYVVVPALLMIITGYPIPVGAQTLQDAISAIKREDMNYVRGFIEKGTDINVKDKDGCNLLCWAAVYEKADIALFLIAKGADVNTKENNGWTPLHRMAAYATKTDILNLFIEKGADVNAGDKQGVTPLILAMDWNRTNIARILIQKGADVNARDKRGMTPLLFAAKMNNAEMARHLIEKGADINAKDNGGSTPVSLALTYDSINTMRVLIEKGANVNDDVGWKNNSKLLHSATIHGKTDITRLLVEKGANINAKNDDGNTPLYYAIHSKKIDLVRYLLEKEADINAKNKDGWTALHKAASEGYADIVRLLIEKGADVNAKNNNFGSTPMTYALQNDYVDVVRILMENGAIVDEKEALKDAAQYNRMKLTAFFVERGANVNDRYRNGETLLHLAAEGKTDAARFLIKKGANVNAKDNDGSTPLHKAAYYDNVAMIHLLIENGADADKEDNKGDTPVETAKKYGKDKAKQAFREAKNKYAAKKTETPAYSPKSAVKETPFVNIHEIPDFKSAPRQNDIAVVIGIENYRGLPKSEYSKSDAGIVKDYLKALGYQERNIALLIDDKASLSDIKKTVETWLPNKVKKDSKVVIYFSGHGAPEPKTGAGYIVPFDGDPGYLDDTGYSLKRLYEKLGKLKAAQIVVLLDSCFSGSGGRSVLAQGARPLVMMAEAPVKSNNLAVLSATQGVQISTSSPEKGHGVFTYYFLKALKEGKKSLSEIYETVKPQVEDEAKQINVQQTPGLYPAPEKLAGRFLLR